MTAPKTSVGASGGEPLASTEHHDWLTEEMNRQHAAGIPNLDNVGGGAIDVDRDDDEDVEEPHPYVCPTCGGNGCRACGDTGELVEWSR